MHFSMGFKGLGSQGWVGDFLEGLVLYEIHEIGILFWVPTSLSQLLQHESLTLGHESLE